MPVFKLGVVLEQGVCEYLADAYGETFFDACEKHATSDALFAKDFDRRNMTFKHRRLVNLDAHFQGSRTQPRLN